MRHRNNFPAIPCSVFRSVFEAPQETFGARFCGQGQNPVTELLDQKRHTGSGARLESVVKNKKPTGPECLRTEECVRHFRPDGMCPILKEKVEALMIRKSPVKKILRQNGTKLDVVGQTQAFDFRYADFPARALKRIERSQTPAAGIPQRRTDRHRGGSQPRANLETSFGPEPLHQ